MSVQRRLTVVFVLIVIVPLAAAGLIVQRLVVDEIGRRAALSLGPFLNAAVVVYNGQAEVIDQRVRAAVANPRFGALLTKEDTQGILSFLSRRVNETEGLDFLIALDRSGRVLGEARSNAVFVGAFSPPDIPTILNGGTAGPGFNRTARIPVVLAGRGRVGQVVGGFWLDQKFLIAPQSDVDLSVVSDGVVIATTIGLDIPVRLNVPSDGSTFLADIGGEAHAKARLLPGNMAVVASTPGAPIADLARKVLISLLVLLLIALAVTTVFAHLLARLITQPLGELAAGAEAITQGRFDRKIRVRSRDEIGQLAAAFNEMTTRLHDTVTELSTSRDRIRRTVRRVGETLRSTHDMTQMMQLILETSTDAVTADAAALWRFTPTREELFPAIARNLEVDPATRIRVGDGVIGFVAERGAGVRLPREHGDLKRAADEPVFPVVVAIPIYSSQARMMGVLAVYRTSSDRPFTEEDVETLLFLTDQGGVAIENVLLHEEAQRLSLTDGLTGVWNRRYYQMQFRQVLATATRFSRPFSVMMLDLDHFKRVNDNHGHQRGDAVLIEFSQRVKSVLREVDTLARYGGEEFICLLAETDLAGAVTTAEKVLEAVRSEPFGGPGEPPLQVTVSIGVAAYPDNGETFRKLVDAADKALYLAKSEGRDCARVAPRPETEPSLKLAR